MNYKLISLAKKRCDFICIFYAFGLQMIFLITNPLEQYIGSYVGYAGFIYIGIAWGSGFLIMCILEPILEKKLNGMDRRDFE